MKRTLTCEKCEKEVKSRKELKKLPSGVYCKECLRKKKEEHRKELKEEIYGKRTIKGVRIRTDEKWEREKKRLKEEAKGQSRIKDINKSPKGRPKLSILGLRITRIERTILYNKYIRNGYTIEEANEKITKICERMEEIKEKIRNEVQNQNELNKKFKEEFAKLCN